MRKTTWKTYALRTATVLVFTMLFILPGTSAFAGDVVPVEASETKKDILWDTYEPSEEERSRMKASVLAYEEEFERIEQLYLLSEDDVQYYAHLDYDEVSEKLKPVVLTARTKIIYRYSWVADGASGQILDRNGNVVQENPQFSELFPSDWEPPVAPPMYTDLSAYGYDE